MLPSWRLSLIISSKKGDIAFIYMSLYGIWVPKQSRPHIKTINQTKQSLRPTKESTKMKSEHIHWLHQDYTHDRILTGFSAALQAIGPQSKEEIVFLCSQIETYYIQLWKEAGILMVKLGNNSWQKLRRRVTLGEHQQSFSFFNNFILQNKDKCTDFKHFCVKLYNTFLSVLFFQILK